MKKFLVYLIVTLIVSVISYSQHKVTVTIKVLSDSVPYGSSIYIAGNDDQLGNWKPDSIKLEKSENGVWSKTFSFEKWKKLEFKITLGSWNKEALNDAGLVPSNHKLEVVKDTTVVIKVNLWSDMIEKKPAGQITGIVRYHLNLKGKNIKPRDVIVWLPPFYFIQAEKRYPVLYMHDGQNIFNPKTSFSGIDWQIDEIADSLLRQGLVEEIIIVGIYNTSQRSSEYAENDTGYAYMNFIVDSLKPLIDKNYRTFTSSDYTAAGGSSLAGLIAFMLTWEYPEVFSKAICISPAFKIRRYNIVDNVISFKGEKKDIKIYIDNGDNQLDDSLQTGVDEMLNELKSKGYKQGRELYYFKDINSEHHEKSWTKRFWRALIFLFGTEKGKKLL